MPEHASIHTPLGALTLAAEGGAVTRAWFGAERAPPPAGGVLAAAGEQLAAYFAGRLTRFDVPLAPSGTPFQRRVWDALVGLRHGETVSYGRLAASVGRPSAARAVGLANAKNPIWLLIPCHRVVGSDGALTGYAGGLDRKRWLLEHEGASLFAGSSAAGR